MVEQPQLLPRPRVVWRTAPFTFCRLLGFAPVSNGPDDHDVLRRRWASSAVRPVRDEVDLLIELRLQVDDAVASEAQGPADRSSRRGATSDTLGHVESVLLCRRSSAPDRARKPAAPHCRADLRARCAPRAVPSRRRAPRPRAWSRRSIHAPVDHQRRRFEIHFRLRARLSVLKRQATSRLLKFAGVDRSSGACGCDRDRRRRSAIRPSSRRPGPAADLRVSRTAASSKRTEPFGFS